MSVYARETSVSVDRSRAEIESTLTRYGAGAFAYATNIDKAMIQFESHGRRIVFVLELSDRRSAEFTYFRANKHGRRLPPSEALRKWEQACRQKWRALALGIKAKLEFVHSGISVFEDEFMANILLPDGQTVSDHMRPKIEEAYRTKKLPALTFGGI